MKAKYQWHGEPVKVKFGNCIVKENKDKPLYWYNFECYPEGKACIPALKVTTKNGQSFMISNHFGIGVYKLLKGGWPDTSHFSLDGKFNTKPQLKITEFDPDGYANYEAEREKWQNEHYPEEYKKILSLRKMGRRINKID